MNCLNCDTDNRTGTKFCNECASPLPLACPSCGTINRPGAKFCDECATSLTGQTPSPLSPQETPQPVAQAGSPTETPPPAKPQLPEAERRQLTVMFCDLVDSTALSGQLDPEDLRDVIRAYQAVCTEVIQRYDGHVAQLLGDGLLVYFGYPQAHEDDAQRAIHAGLGMLDAMRTLTQHLERWGQVQDGRGQVVLLSGEAGIGKSRLMQVLQEHVADTPHTRLECRSSPYWMRRRCKRN